ncbi:MAG: phosphate ABC transporter substrate-binding protein PstS [Pseudoxanthomonas suwonensis]|nr:phosphate ABC transporter substrate-binding protein PstS [Pseudoxanthomonas suwonensis]
MTANPVRTTVLALAASLALAACGASDNTAPGGAQGGDTGTAGSSDAVATEITGAGASFIYPLVSRWSADYNNATGKRVNYQSIGSGGGIAQIKAGTVDFGSTDKPLPPAELAEAGLIQFPSAIGGVVPVFNLAGVEPGKLRLTGPLLADIFLGKVATWNDPAIAAVNPGVTLPTDKITVVRRSDGSGTTYNFTNYLSKVSPEWKEKVGEGTNVNWASGVGGKGNEGVASYVQQIRGAIGYVELSYALQNKMPYASMQNAAGNWIEPNAESFSAAAASADWAAAEHFDLVITNATGAEAWPIAATNFMLIYREPRRPQNQKAVLEFFRWAFDQGQGQAAALDYVPLPPELVQQIDAYWTSELK